MSSVADEATVEAPPPPSPHDGRACGVEHHVARLVFHLGDAHLHAAWVRADAGFRADEAVSGLRDAYRVCQFASRRLSTSTAGERRGEAQNPLLTLEVASRTALLRRVRAHVVAVVFDAAMPLGMARLVAARLAAELEPELPREGAASPDPPPSTNAVQPRADGTERRARRSWARRRRRTQRTASRRRWRTARARRRAGCRASRSASSIARGAS